LSFADERFLVVKNVHHALLGVADRPARNAAVSAPTPEQLVGNTPVLWVPDLSGHSDAGFWAKLEGHNPGGIKDRPGLHLVGRARTRGDLAPGAPVIESTSGTLGLGLALAGMLYGHPVRLVTDAGMEPLMRNLLVAYGARVDIVERPHPVGGWQQARRERVAQLLSEHAGAWCPDQYNNPDNVSAYQGLGLELVEQLDAIDVLVCSVGTGGHSAGGVARTAPVLPRSATHRGRRDRLDDFRSAGAPTIDARAGQQHLPTQRRLQGLL
jgi:cysteine synthase